MRQDLADTYDEPFDVDVLDGEVVILGPGSAGIALTAAAAAESARRLAAAARNAAVEAEIPTARADN